MTKKNYESLETNLFDIVHHYMSLPIEKKGTHGKAMLQDVISTIADELGAADKKFKRTEFYEKTGALQYLSN
jgi:hypothetical protein